MDEDTIRIQNLLMEMMSDLDSVFESNDVDYYMSGGCVLGAVRHEGHFIPWDDDMDVAVLHSQLDRLDTALSQLDSEKYIVTPILSPDAPRGFYKIERKGTTFLYEEFPCWPRRVSIEIFPLYKVPDGKISLKMYHGIMGLFTFARVLSEKGGNVIGKLAGRSMIILDRILNLMCERSSGKYLEPRSSFYKRDLLPQETYGKPTRMTFEGKEFCFPENSVNMLKKFYGNYMDLPPVEKRAPIKRKVLSFDTDYSEFVRKEESE